MLHMRRAFSISKTSWRRVEISSAVIESVRIAALWGRSKLSRIRSNCRVLDKQSLMRVTSLAFALWSLAAGTLASAQAPLWTREGFDKFRESYLGYLRAEGKLPEAPAAAEDYLRRKHFDAIYPEQTRQCLDQIAKNQNLDAKMAWVVSYHVQGLTDMYRATGDLKYLRDNLGLLRAALDHTDEKLGHPTFAGVTSPAWGSNKYREGGEYCVHAVHTGMIAGSFLEFLFVAESVQQGVGFEPGERALALEALRRAIEYHESAWTEAEPGAGTWIFRGEYVRYEGQPLPLNMNGALALAHYWYWRNTGSEVHRRRVEETARYVKARLPVFISPHNGEEVCFWAYRLSEKPLENPRPWEEAVALDGGEDLSHSGVSVSFIIELAKAGIVFDAKYLRMLKETVFQGFGRRRDGILAANVAGQYGNEEVKPLQVINVGYWMELGEFHPEVWDRLLPHFLCYESPPRTVDLAILVRLSIQREKLARK